MSESARGLIAGRRVLVTGSAGSIGSELVRQLVSLSPAAVYRLDIDEGRMHAMQLRLTNSAFTDDDQVVLADVRDRRQLLRTFDRLRPDLVFHAAALKHVNLLERFPGEGVKTNIGGSHAVLDAAVQSGVSTFINVSTDKAADPTSVLGATKRVAEMLVQARASDGTGCASVRFGNVLGSRGSFYDTLAHQIASGRPVTVTHPDVTRFFMTIPEAVALVIHAAADADRGEIHVLDMGEPVRIIDLVHRYAAALGVSRPKIHITGLGPGEKLHESLFAAHEIARPSTHPRITLAPPDAIQPDFDDRLSALYAAADGGDDPRVREALTELIPTYGSRSDRLLETA